MRSNSSRWALTISAAVGVVMFWSLPSVLAQGAPDIVWEVEGHDGSVKAVTYSADGQMVVSGSGDQTVKLWQAADGTLLDTFAGQPSGVLSVDLSADGQYLAAGFIESGYPPGGLTNLWDREQHTVLHTPGGCFASFSASGEFIATGGGGANRYLQVHRTATGGSEWSAYTGAYVTDVAYSPADTLVASCGTHNNVQLWDAANGNLVRTLTGHTDDVSTIAFSSDGGMLASGAGGWDDPGESTIKLWQVSDGTLLRTLPGHGVWVYALAFSPDGGILLSAGRDQDLPNLVITIRLWDVASGALLQTYDQATNNGVLSVAFSPDGRYFAYGRGDRRVVVARNPFAPAVGDLNCDGRVNSYDIDGFVCAVSSTCDYEGVFADCDRMLADINGDGEVNAYDIDPFVSLLGSE